MAHITFEKGSVVDIRPPRNWQLVRRTNNGSDLGQAIYDRRVMLATEPITYTWSFSESVKAVGGMLRYTGVMPTGNPVVSSGGSTGTSSTLRTPSVGADAKSMLLTFYGFKKKSTMLSVPAGMTGRYNFENPNDVTIRASDQYVEAGATGVRDSFSDPSTSDKWVAQSIVLRAAN